MTDSDFNFPSCPITGMKATKHIQSISVKFLKKIWKITFKTNSKSSFGDVKIIDLWESPTGLYFFSPAIEGDLDFYSQFYKRMLKKKLISDCDFGSENIKPYIKKYIRNNFSVLDVGCGKGLLARLLNDIRYTGIDPHTETDGIKNIYKISLKDHLVNHENFYDVVCAFEVLEHVSDPKLFFSQMVQAVKPGGVVVVSVPSIKSIVTHIPNFLINSPPHHLTWWSEDALKYLAIENQLFIEVLEVSKLSNKSSKLVYWIAKCSLIKTTDYFYKNSFWVHVSSIVSYLLAKFILRFFGFLKIQDLGLSLVLIARKRS